ncbi:MAG: DUF1624 domain-containing protein [Oscillospiraceae bacterium]|nr:DUF1624 domain-containing protein [Oscillospiraceae bacterium]
MKKRIWELDALRGLCILCVVFIHFMYDMTDLYGIISFEYPAVYLFIQQWGGVLFLLISGICVTLGSHCIRRGILVFLCGLVISAVTAGMYFLGMADKSVIIYFGVLHCLGVCMLLWPLFRKLPNWALATIGAVLAVAGLLLSKVQMSHNWLMPLGLYSPQFASADYFPLLPHFGFFLLGAFLGRTAYRKQQSLLPKVNPEILPIRFLQLCGKHSLWIYLLHQPIFSGIFWLILSLK